MPSSSLDNQFSIDNKSNNRGNNAIAIIKELFLNIRHKLSYKRLTEKVIQEMYESFLYFLIHMTFKDQIAFCSIKLWQ